MGGNIGDLAVSLLCDGVNFSLKVFRVCRGKVCPFSQISMSFLIFSCIEEYVSGGSCYTRDSREFFIDATIRESGSRCNKNFSRLIQLSILLFKRTF